MLLFIKSKKNNYCFYFFCNYWMCLLYVVVKTHASIIIYDSYFVYFMYVYCILLIFNYY